MTLRDVSNGPDWVIWAVFVLFVIMTILFLSGKGGWLIAGYNTMSQKDKAKYNQKKMCRVMGAGWAVMDIVLLMMALGQDVFPAWSANIFTAVMIVDAVSLIVIVNRFCRK